MSAGDLIGTVNLGRGHRVSVHDDGDGGRSITRHVVGMTVRMSLDADQARQLADLLTATSDANPGDVVGNFGDDLDDLSEGEDDE